MADNAVLSKILHSHGIHSDALHEEIYALVAHSREEAASAALERLKQGHWEHVKVYQNEESGEPGELRMMTDPLKLDHAEASGFMVEFVVDPLTRAEYAALALSPDHGEWLARHDNEVRRVAFEEMFKEAQRVAEFSFLPWIRERLLDIEQARLASLKDDTGSPKP